VKPPPRLSGTCWNYLPILVAEFGFVHATRSVLKLIAKELEVWQGDLGPGLILDDGNNAVFRCKSLYHLLDEAALREKLVQVQILDIDGQPV
jgi:hypothetical protein